MRALGLQTLGLCLAFCGATAQDASIRATGGFSLSIYDDQDRVTAVLSYESAAKEADSEIATLTGLSLDLLSEDADTETVQWRIQSAECSFDFDENRAQSSSSTTFSSADEGTRVIGNGFEWDQKTGVLSLPSHSESVLALLESDSTLTVTSERFEFQNRTGKALYLGNVVVQHPATGDQMSADRLELELAQDSGRPLRGKALGEVVLTSTLDSEPLYVRSDAAHFDLQVPREESIEFPTGLHWTAADYEGRGNYGRGSHMDRAVVIRGAAQLSGPFQAGVATIRSEEYTITSDQIVFDGETELQSDAIRVKASAMTVHQTEEGSISEIQASEAQLTTRDLANQDTTTISGELLTLTNGVNGLDSLRAQGNASWAQGGLSGEADRLTMAPESNTMVAEGSAKAFWSDPSRPESPPLHIVAERYQVDANSAQFTGAAQLWFGEWSWRAATIELEPRDGWEGLNEARGGPSSRIQREAGSPETSEGVGRFQLDSDTAQMAFTSDKLEPTSVTAQGNIRFESDLRVATGQRADYKLSEESVTISGTPEISEADGKRFLGGADSKVTYDLEKGAIHWDGPSRFIIPGKALKARGGTSKDTQP